MLDKEGREIESNLGYLVRQAVVDRVAGPMRLRGMYSYMADAARLTECQTGRAYPVLLEGDHLAVEKGYGEARVEPGAGVLVTIDARFVERATEPGLPLREHLVVEKLDRFSPGGSCAKAIAVAEAPGDQLAAGRDCREVRGRARGAA